jgi:hypothetical protein
VLPPVVAAVVTNTARRNAFDRWTPTSTSELEAVIAVKGPVSWLAGTADQPPVPVSDSSTEGVCVPSVTVPEMNATNAESAPLAVNPTAEPLTVPFARNAGPMLALTTVVS